MAPSFHLVEEILPPPKPAALRLQPAPLIHASAVAVALVGGASQLSKDPTGLLIDKTLFACDIAAFIRTAARARRGAGGGASPTQNASNRDSLIFSPHKES